MIRPKRRLTAEEAHARYIASVERSKQLTKRRTKAHVAVARAVKNKDLKPAREMVCVDCGKQAFCYDHRDYSKPLDVDPVCKRCDCMRGAGLPYDGADQRWYRRMSATIKRMAQIENTEHLTWEDS